jgi:hypothetical protein
MRVLTVARRVAHVLRGSHLHARLVFVSRPTWSRANTALWCPYLRIVTTAIDQMTPPSCSSNACREGRAVRVAGNHHLRCPVRPWRNCTGYGQER